MKKVFFILFILIINYSFSQTERNIQSSVNFSSIIEEKNHFVNYDEKPIYCLGEIVDFEIPLPNSNSEGKFKMHTIAKHPLFSKNTNNTIKSSVIVYEEVEEKKQSESLVIDTNNELVNAIIIKMKLEGDLILKPNFYNTYFSDNPKNKIIGKQNKKVYSVTKLSNNSAAIIVGGLNIKSDKVFKNMIENTLRNSLNLLVINF